MYENILSVCSIRRNLCESDLDAINVYIALYKEKGKAYLAMKRVVCKVARSETE